MYASTESVLRWQRWPCFLARASMTAGIVLENPAESQGSADIGAVSEEAQNVINGFSQEGDHARASLMVVVVKLFLIGLGDTGALTRVIFLSGGGRAVAGGRLLRPGSSRSPYLSPGTSIGDGRCPG